MFIAHREKLCSVRVPKNNTVPAAKDRLEVENARNMHRLSLPSFIMLMSSTATSISLRENAKDALLMSAETRHHTTPELDAFLNVDLSRDLRDAAESGDMNRVVQILDEGNTRSDFDANRSEVRVTLRDLSVESSYPYPTTATDGRGNLR